MRNGSWRFNLMIFTEWTFFFVCLLKQFLCRSFGGGYFESDDDRLWKHVWQAKYFNLMPLVVAARLSRFMNTADK